MLLHPKTDNLSKNCIEKRRDSVTKPGAGHAFMGPVFPV